MITFLEYVCAALCGLLFIMLIVDIIRRLLYKPIQPRSKVPDDIGDIRRKLYGKDSSSNDN